MSDMQPTMPSADLGKATKARGHIMALLRDLVHNCAALADDEALPAEARQHATRTEMQRIADRIWTEAFVAGVAWQMARQPAKFVIDVGQLDAITRENLLANLRQSAGKAPL